MPNKAKEKNMSLSEKIKKSAEESGAIIQSSEADKLSKIFNRMFYCEKDKNEEVKFINQVITRGQETSERKGLHASNMLVPDNEFCLRAQVLSLVYKQEQGENIMIGLKRIFEEGNAIHEKWQRLFIRAGYGKATDMDYTTYYSDYHLNYSPDAIITVPEFYNKPMVVEIKSVNTFAFQKQIKHPSAWKQAYWYMYLSKLDKAIVLSEDKNTQDFKLEVYNFDESVVAPYIERAEEITYQYNKLISEHKIVKRPTEAISPNCKKCTKCNMKNACWNIGFGRIKLE